MIPQITAIKLSAEQLAKAKRLVEIQDDKAQRQLVVSLSLAGIISFWLSDFNIFKGVYS